MMWQEAFSRWHLPEYEITHLRVGDQAPVCVEFNESSQAIVGKILIRLAPQDHNAALHGARCRQVQSMHRSLKMSYPLPYIAENERPQPGGPHSQPAQEALPAGIRPEGSVQHAQLGPQGGVAAGLAEEAAPPAARGAACAQCTGC